MFGGYDVMGRVDLEYFLVDLDRKTEPAAGNAFFLPHAESTYPFHDRFAHTKQPV